MKFSHDHFVETTKHMARQLNRIRNTITNSIDFQFVARINKNISYPPSFITILILTLHLQNLFHFHLSIVLESIPSNNPSFLDQTLEHRLNVGRRRNSSGHYSKRHPVYLFRPVSFPTTNNPASVTPLPKGGVQLAAPPRYR